MVHGMFSAISWLFVYIYIYIHLPRAALQRIVIEQEVRVRAKFDASHCKKLKVILTLLWLFELQIVYTIATAGKCFRDKHRAMSNLASETTIH